MSTNKTVYPGMSASDNGGFQGINQQRPMTQFPGMEQNLKTGSKHSKPIMGFLYSVSKTSYGEYWPLYVGPNEIGRGNDCSICLKEASVSEKHATLVIRNMVENGKKIGVVVFIQDTGSMYGTMLNGVTLDFNPKECKSGDIITIGANYELYFILVDPDLLGLSPKEDFKCIETVANVDSDWGKSSPVGVHVGDDYKGTLPGTGQTPFDVVDGRKQTMTYSPKK